MIVNYNTNITLTGKLPRLSMMLAPVNRNQAGPFNQVFKYKSTYSKTWYPTITLEASQNANLDFCVTPWLINWAHWLNRVTGLPNRKLPYSTIWLIRHLQKLQRFLFGKNVLCSVYTDTIERLNVENLLLAGWMVHDFWWPHNSH